MKSLYLLKRELQLHAMQEATTYQGYGMAGLLYDAHDTIVKMEQALKYIRSIAVNERAWPSEMHMTALSLMTKESNKYLDDYYDVGSDGRPYSRESEASDKTV